MSPIFQNSKITQELLIQPSVDTIVKVAGNGGLTDALGREIYV